MCQCMCGGAPTSRQMLFCACSSYSCPAMYSFLGGEGVYHVLYAVLSVLTNQVADFQGADRLYNPLGWDINFTSKHLLRWTLFLMNYKTKWIAFFVAINVCVYLRHIFQCTALLTDTLCKEMTTFAILVALLSARSTTAVHSDV